MRAPRDTLESIVVPIMAYSDMTLLANFSTVALWPIYFFNGLTSKYIRAKLSQHTISHIFHR